MYWKGKMKFSSISCNGKASVEKSNGRELMKNFRTDNGGEYMFLIKFDGHLKSEGIRHSTQTS